MYLLRRATAVAVVSLVAVSAITACGRGASGTKAAGDSKCVVAYSQGSLTGEWRVENSRDMKDEVTKGGCSFIQADANNDPAKQLQDVNDLLSKKPSLLVVSPVQSEPLATVPALAQSAGVPMIVVDRALPGDPGTGEYKALMTTDFVQTGTWVAQSVVKALTAKNGSPKGTIVHIAGTTGASPAIDEQKGIDGVLSQYPNIKIAATCDGDYAGEPSRKCMEDLLQRFGKGSIDGVIVDNDEGALAAIAAIKAANRTELLGWVWGKDAQRTGLQAILDGQMRMTVSTPPQYGAMVMAAFKKLQSGQTPQAREVLPKTQYENDSAADKQKIEDRINELQKLGIDCC